MNSAQQRREALAKRCEISAVNNSLRLEIYFRKAKTLFKEAQTYFEQRELDLAYVYLKRFNRLCIHVIPSHHSFNSPVYSKDKYLINQSVRESLTMLEVVVRLMDDEDSSADEDDLIIENAQESCPSEKVRTAGIGIDLERRLQSLRADQDQTVTTTAVKTMDTSLMNILRPQSSAIQKPSSVSTKSNYPTVGKASWMNQNDKLQSTQRIVPKRRQSFENAVRGELRNIVIPGDFIQQFTRIADPNTRKQPHGLETCGILAGTLEGLNLVITTLIIPKQEGSSDMCTMTNEDELFDFCIGNNLLTLGWIHTHPQQSCFMSSVDLHTHCGFQSALPEAIAIVVAPSDARKTVGVFRLTMPTGLEFIQSCKFSGFHQHPENIDIYSDASECRWESSSVTSVIDLR